MYRLIRPLLFRLDAERAHHLTLNLLSLPMASWLGPLFQCANPCLAVSAFGLPFRNPVGLAAGYDKNGAALRGLAALGFGHIEAGTVTLGPQPGNPRPRVFRLTADGALINRMGFPNEGVEPLAAQPALSGLPCRLGLNIGKSRATPLEQAAEDYAALLARLASRADYIAINISSPNTPGLRQLQSRAFFDDLLRQIAEARARLDRPVPLLVKIAPDLDWPELDDILAAILAHKFDGLIAGNTTLSRAGLSTPAPLKDETGGLSGRPLRARATEIIRYCYRRTGGKLPIIGVGGVDGPAAALEKLKAGATLVQVYTGLIYEGPGLIRAINRGLAESGARSVMELIGSEA